MDDIEKEVVSIISYVSGFDEDDIKPDTNLVEELDVDSIKAIEIAVAVEKKFKIKVRDEDIAVLTAPSMIVDLARKMIHMKEESL